MEEERSRRERSVSLFPIFGQSPTTPVSEAGDPEAQEVEEELPQEPFEIQDAPIDLRREPSDIREALGDRRSLGDKVGALDILLGDEDIEDKLSEIDEDSKRESPSISVNEEDELELLRRQIIRDDFDDSGLDIGAEDEFDERLRRLRGAQEFVERAPEPRLEEEEKDFLPEGVGTQLQEFRLGDFERGVDPLDEVKQLHEEEEKEEKGRDEELERNIRDLPQAVRDELHALEPRVLDGGVRVAGLNQFSGVNLDLGRYFNDLANLGITPYIDQSEPGDRVTVRQISDFIGDRIDPRTGIPISVENVTPRNVASGLADILDEVVVDALAKAIREGGSQEDVGRALTTVVTGLDDAGRGLPDHARQLLGRSVNLLLNLRLKALGSVQPSVGVNMDALVNTLGQGIFDALSGLSSVTDQETRGEIRSDVGKALINREADPRSLKLFSSWVNKNVKDDVLRALLENDIENRLQFIERTNTEFKQLRQQEGVPQQLRVAIRTVPPEIEEKLTEELTELKETLKLQGKGAIQRDIRRATERLNEKLKEWSVRGIDGEIINIPVQAGTAPERIRRFEKHIRSIIRGGSRITFITPGGIGVMGKQDSDVLLQELVNSLRRPTKFGTIRDLDELDKVLFCNEVTVINGGDGKYQIIILQSVSIECLLKLSHALIQEPGTLLSQNGEFQIGMGRGTRSVGELIRFIQMLFIHNMGGPVTINYETRSLMGGHFVGGALRKMYEKPLFGTRSDNKILGMPLSMFHRYGGGLKVSDVSTGIAGVASGLAASGIGAPIALPVAAISGIISGLGKIFGF